MKRFKRFSALLTMLALSFALSAPALGGSGPGFQDVPEDAYYYSAVEWAWLRDITKGTSASTFEPNAACTRGQVATFLWRAKECPKPKTRTNPFTDVKASSPFYQAILWAYENGITAGTTKTTFSPSSPCTRAHVLTFLWRAEGKPDAPYSELADYRLPQGYWTDAFRWADSRRLLSMTDVSPENPCPRSDIVYYLYLAMNQEGTKGAEADFPLPTGEAFGLKGEDALLYTAVAKVLCPDAIKGDLLLPSLTVYGSYDGGEGKTHYVCGLLRYYYYGLDTAHPAQHPETQVGAAGTLARITIQNGACAAILETEDGATAAARAARIQEICGPLTALAQSLQEETAKGRQLTPDTWQALLAAYMEHCF